MTAATRRRPAARKSVSKPAAEATKLDWNQLIETALTMPGSTGDTYCRFREYSWLNQVLLASQGVTEPVNTYNGWLTLGRQVRKGSTAHRINRPIIVKSKNHVDENGDPTKLRLFKEVACLFTASQTDGDELPPAPVRGWVLQDALGVLAITQVPYESLDGNKQGHSIGRTFAINPVAVHPLRTTFHELAHIVLGHTTPGGLAEYQLHRGSFEFEAEATAYLLMHELGLLDEQSASHSRAYIQGWLRGVDGAERVSDGSIKAVFSAVTTILAAGRPAKAEEESS